MMSEVSFIKCPRCQCMYWQDIPDVKKHVKDKWKCSRCSYVIVPGPCSGCRTKKWVTTKGIDPKGGHRPYYRLQCRTCGRVIGFLVFS
jgi:hypothetical protein